MGMAQEVVGMGEVDLEEVGMEEVEDMAVAMGEGSEI